MKNSQVKEIYDQIELDEFSKEKMYQKIKEKAYSKKEEKRKMWNYKKITSLIAVCACAIIVISNPGVKAKIKEYVNNYASWIMGNSKDDYLEDINEIVQNNNMSLNIISSQRIDNEVRLRYELYFPKNIENIININDYGYIVYKDENGQYPTIKRIFNSDIFEQCKIYINGLSTGYMNSSEFGLNNESFWYFDVKDIEIKENKLTQEVIVLLDDDYIREDVNFKFEFNKFKIDNEVINANLKYEYILKGGTYSNEERTIKLINNEVELDSNKIYNFYGYSYTKTGIQIYAKREGDFNNESVNYLIVKDNFGTKYLMYPDSKPDDKNVTYKIYNENLENNKEYSEEFNKNIESLDIEFIVENYNENAENVTVKNKISEFKIDFKENNK